MSLIPRVVVRRWLEVMLAVVSIAMLYLNAHPESMPRALDLSNDANLSLASATPPFDFNSPTAPIYSRPRFLPPTLLEGAHVSGSLIADGCRIGRGAVIENSSSISCRDGGGLSAAAIGSRSPDRRSWT